MKGESADNICTVPNKEMEMECVELHAKTKKERNVMDDCYKKAANDNNNEFKHSDTVRVVYEKGNRDLQTFSDEEESISLELDDMKSFSNTVVPKIGGEDKQTSYDEEISISCELGYLECFEDYLEGGYGNEEISNPNS